MDLYKEEKAEMLKLGIFDKVFLALSREKDTPKVGIIFFLTNSWIIKL